MSSELGAWLRQQREARGWTRPEMARQLIRAGEAKGDKSLPGMSSMCHNIYRWERGADGLSERYKLCYCQALAIPPSHFGPGQPAGEQSTAPAPGTSMPTAPGSPLTPPLAQVPPPPGLLSDPRLPVLVAIAYRGLQELAEREVTVGREVLMAAHEGSENAERAEERGIGEATLEQLRSDVTRLSRDYMTGEPFPLFLEMRRVRARMHDALDRRMWPRDATDLYLLLGCLNDLMAIAAYDLGYPEAAEELLRAGWAYAVAIDHRPLMAQLRMQLAGTLAWQQPQRSREYAASGLQYLSEGPNAAQLYLVLGRAAARLGDADAAREAISAADEAHERDYHDDLTGMGGEFAFSWATHSSYTGATLIEIPSAAPEAVTALERAAELYAAGPGPGDVHSAHCEMLARADLAAARLRAGALDAAIDALQPVLSLPPGQRISGLPRRLGRVRADLAAPIFRGATRARELEGQIEEFSRDTITAGLHSLPGGPG